MAVKQELCLTPDCQARSLLGLRACKSETVILCWAGSHSDCVHRNASPCFKHCYVFYNEVPTLNGLRNSTTPKFSSGRKFFGRTESFWTDGRTENFRTDGKTSDRRKFFGRTENVRTDGQAEKLRTDGEVSDGRTEIFRRTHGRTERSLPFEQERFLLFAVRTGEISPVRKV